MYLKSVLERLDNTITELSEYKKNVETLIDTENLAVDTAILLAKYSKCILECMIINREDANTREIQKDKNNIFYYKRDDNSFNNNIASINEFDIGVPSCLPEELEENEIKEAIDLVNKTFKEKLNTSFELIDYVAA